MLKKAPYSDMNYKHWIKIILFDHYSNTNIKTFQIRFKDFQKGLLRNNLQRMLAWCLILSVTLVSTAILMAYGQYFAILPQTEKFFDTSRTMVLLFSNSFNIFHVLLTPFIFKSFNKHYYNYVVGSTALIGFACIGRYFAGTNYAVALFMAIIVAIAHIPIISAPYGLLKLFPQEQRGYAASIPLFLPALGINFCILYDMIYITGSDNENLSTQEVNNRINSLSLIIAIIGLFSSIITIYLYAKLKDKIQAKEQSQQSPAPEKSFIDGMIAFTKNHKLTIKVLICWGSIVGINWTYGALFGIIFEGQGLSEKEIALLGLAANLSTALFSNLGTYIKNKFKATNTSIIGILNLVGFLAAILLQASKYIDSLSNLYLMIVFVVVLRSGFSSFVSLAFFEMEESGIPSVDVSNMFFWVANLVNLIGMELVDFLNIDLSLAIITVTAAICIHFVAESYIMDRVK